MFRGTAGASNIVPMVLLVSIAVVGGAGGDLAAAREPTVAVAEHAVADSLLRQVRLDGHESELPVLRSEVDRERGRMWVLTQEGLHIFDLGTRQEIGRVVLPDWVWVGEPRSCSPDLALGSEGEAYVSSDVVPTLWRVDPVTFAASRHELALDDDTDKDVGFSALAYSAEQRRLFAVSYLHGSLWRIDPSTGTARKIPLATSIPKACGPAARLRVFPQQPDRTLDLCVPANRGPWVVKSAPGYGSGNVVVRSCPND